MIAVVTGGRCVGKSTYFERCFEAERALNRDTMACYVGLFSQKWYDDGGGLMGYDLMGRCGKMERKWRLCWLKEQVEVDDCRFVFDADVFVDAEKWVLRCLLDGGWRTKNNSHLFSIWIDEVGFLEYRGMGFAPLLNEVFIYENKNPNLIHLHCVVRQELWLLPNNLFSSSEKVVEWCYQEVDQFGVREKQKDKEAINDV